MYRRSLLTAVVGASGVGAGCLAGVLRRCPDPELDDELSIETRESSELRDLWDGAALVTTAEEVDHLDSPVFRDDDRDWVRETDFERDVVVGVQVGSSGQSSDLRVLGVGRTGDVLEVYTCIARPGRTDDWVAYARLLRVPHDGEIPRSATLTHWESGEETVYE